MSRSNLSHFSREAFLSLSLSAGIETRGNKKISERTEDQHQFSSVKTRNQTWRLLGLELSGDDTRHERGRYKRRLFN
jgi:hypothetical protein